MEDLTHSIMKAIVNVVVAKLSWILLPAGDQYFVRSDLGNKGVHAAQLFAQENDLPLGISLGVQSFDAFKVGLAIGTGYSVDHVAQGARAVTIARLNQRWTVLPFIAFDTVAIHTSKGFAGQRTPSNDKDLVAIVRQARLKSCFRY